jgi:hypothetical protein
MRSISALLSYAYTVCSLYNQSNLLRPENTMSTYTYRKYSPHHVVSSVLLGYDLWRYKETHHPTRKEWGDYVEAQGINVKRAATLIRMAKKLYCDPVKDRGHLDEVASLRIPWMALVGACSDAITDEQRIAFFEAISQRGHPETLSDEEAWSILRSIAYPIKQGVLPIPPTSEPGDGTARVEVMQALGEALRQTLSPVEYSALMQGLSAAL